MKKEKSFFDKAKLYIKKEEENVKTNQKKQFFYFVLGFVVFYLVFSTIAQSFPSGTFESITGNSVNTILNSFGQKTNTSTGSIFTIFIQDKEIGISWLCSGVIEIIILVSAILASFGITWKDKLVGVVWAIIIGYFFNLLRIIITINIILTQNAQVFELAHDLLFRLTLFIYIVIFYVVWFYWAQTKK